MILVQRLCGPSSVLHWCSLLMYWLLFFFLSGPQTVSFPACSSVCVAATFLQRCVNEVISQAWLSAAGMWLSLYLLSRLSPSALTPSTIRPPSALTPAPTVVHSSPFLPLSIHPRHHAATDWLSKQQNIWLDAVHRQTEPDNLDWIERKREKLSAPLQGDVHVRYHHSVTELLCKPTQDLRTQVWSLWDTRGSDTPVTLCLHLQVAHLIPEPFSHLTHLTDRCFTWNRLGLRQMHVKGNFR